MRVINPSPEMGTTLTPRPTYIPSSCRVLVEACCVFVAVVVMRSRCGDRRWVVVGNGEWGNERTLECQGTTNSPVIPATQNKARLYYADVINRNAVPISSLGMFSSSLTCTYPFNLTFGPETTGNGNRKGSVKWSLPNFVLDP